MTHANLHVTAVHVYPVKSLGGISPRAVKLTDRGFQLDRRWMVVSVRDEMMTQREVPKMATIWVEALEGGIELAHDAMDEPLYIPFDATQSDARSVVSVWGSSAQARHVGADADAWLSECLGQSVKLMHMPDDSQRPCNVKYAKHGEIVSFADGFPFLLTSEASLGDLNRRISDNGGQPVPMSRFRSNIVVNGSSAWAEDDWKEVRIGAHVFRVVKPCGRCQVTTTDQSTGEVRGPEPLATLGSFRDSDLGILFGQNLTCVDSSGTISVGDAVEVLR